jgi:hypothetical protein
MNHSTRTKKWMTQQVSEDERAKNEKNKRAGQEND